MKKMIQLLAYTITLMLMSGCATSARTSGITTIVSFSFHDKGYSQNLSEDDFYGCPDWEPEGKPCPLPLSKAIELARSHLRHRFPNVAVWTWDGSASINRFPSGKWYYQVSLDDNNPDRQGDILRVNQISVIVCLNGRIPAIVEDGDEAKQKGVQNARTHR